ncbi:UDP-N-acetylglucosamine 1-carboxyvinyltransferase [Thermincola potens]|uniref:UDP-N-acetylglucosamine 1-carboxyvinyltransferase n=1 Tax=Thermincola potens (strain JR) TaxID=635013 RepID=D5X998_THEPJ|nr:UDP-N-acetylglucosamine 1-carboxyvinyltransferase [Thermincola potens]ADG83002.1 UDP-N-acetylglucosamine 1-carboxyvinyltransferase [Thermincola potens JR]
MQKFIVIGGKRLNGRIRVSGAKNATLPVLAASLLTDKGCLIHEVPKLKDIDVMKEVLKYLGSVIECRGSSLKLDNSRVCSKEISEDLMRRMRASNLVMGPLLARFGHVRAAYPGGCAIGSRPMDLHLKGFAALGAEITEKHGFVEARANCLKGAEIHLDFPSVGATENLMMAAVLARGQTVIKNAAKEPEIVDLQNFLNSLGAKVRGAGTDVIKIEGVGELELAEHTVIPDRIEAATHLIAGAITAGEVVVENVIPEHLDSVIAKLREAGADIQLGQNWIKVASDGKFKAVDVKTLPYPGFPTDVQAQLMVLMTVAQGTSIISESIFENRFKHVDELRRMGADIKIEGRTAIVKGTSKLSGTFVEATDLRAGAALVLAGLIAEDATVIENIWHIDRGYEDLEKKYSALGARIMRVNSV